MKFFFSCLIKFYNTNITLPLKKQKVILNKTNKNINKYRNTYPNFRNIKC